MSVLSEDHVPFRLPPMNAAPESDTDFFSFEGSVGPNGENRREDVIKAQTLLARTGDFQSPFEMPTGWPSSDLFKGIKAFQTRHGKQADSTLLPVPVGGVDENGVGESLEALRSDVGNDVAGQTAPTPSQVDAHYENAARFQNTVVEEAQSSVTPDGEPLSDEPPVQQIWQSGGQSAQLSPVHQQAMQQAAQASQRLLGLSPGPGNPPRDQNGISEDEKKLSRELERRVKDKLNLLNFAPQLIGAVMRDPQAFLPAESKPATTTSEPISERDIKHTQTPPLSPPEVNEKLQGRPAEEREPAIEQLIPPEMKDWYEGLEPFDQELLRQFVTLNINIHGSRGKPSTQYTDLRIAKLLIEERDKYFPELRGIAEHLYGSYKDGIKEPGQERLKQEAIRKPGSATQLGGSRPDITAGHPDREDIRARINSVNGKWVDIGDGAKMFVQTDKEPQSFSNLLENIGHSTAVTIPKIHTMENEAAWEAIARPLVRIALEGFWRRIGVYPGRAIPKNGMKCIQLACEFASNLVRRS